MVGVDGLHNVKIICILLLKVIAVYIRFSSI